MSGSKIERLHQTHLAIECMDCIVGALGDGLNAELAEPLSHQEGLGRRDERIQLRRDEEGRRISLGCEVERRERSPVVVRVGHPRRQEAVKKGVGDECLQIRDGVFSRRFAERGMLRGKVKDERLSSTSSSAQVAPARGRRW